MGSALLRFHPTVFTGLTNIAKACGRRKPLQISAVSNVTAMTVSSNYRANFSEEDKKRKLWFCYKLREVQTNSLVI